MSGHSYKICKEHLALRWTCGDWESDITVQIGSPDVEGECADCDLIDEGKLDTKYHAENITVSVRVKKEWETT